MSTLTKQWLQQKIAEMEAARDEIPFGLDEDDSNTLAALRIALASLEAEAVGTFRKGPCGYSPSFHEDAVPLYTAHPAPVSVPEPIKRNDADGWWMYKGRRVGGGCAEWYNRALDDCRAAMLQGAEPVTTAYKLPDDFDFDRFNDVVWLEAVASNPHMHSLTTSTIAMVALELNKRMNVANSPAIPDGWVMVPMEPTEDMCDVGHVGIDVLAGVTDENEYYSTDGKYAAKVYRAMIAAAPQQEVK